MKKAQLNQIALPRKIASDISVVTLQDPNVISPDIINMDITIASTTVIAQPNTNPTVIKPSVISHHPNKHGNMQQLTIALPP